MWHSWGPARVQFQGMPAESKDCQLWRHKQSECVYRGKLVPFLYGEEKANAEADADAAA